VEYVFYDLDRIKRRDDDHSEYEERWQTIGMFDKVLFVVYTEEITEGNIRIISARQASPKERRIYNGNSETYPYGWSKAKP